MNAQPALMHHTLADVVAATGGHLVCPAGLAPRSVSVAGFSSDTRSLALGDAFFALSGPTFDGHAFLADAFANGAACAVVTHIPPGPVKHPYVLVQDVLHAWGAMARDVRDCFGGTVIAITGTSGKTTTKEILSHILAAAGLNVLKTFANENNQIGVPKTLFNLTPSHDVAVIELGTNHPGEIAALASIVNADVALLTNVGPGHLEALIDLDGVAAEKGALLASLREDGLAILNANDPNLPLYQHHATGKVLTVGTHNDTDWQAHGLKLSCAGTDAITFTVKGVPVSLPTLGVHNVENALLAIAAADACGVSVKAATEALASAPFPSGRLTVHHLMDATILDDSYNANPLSMQAALKTLAAYPLHNGRRVAVLGDMCELGTTAKEAHGRLAHSLAQHRVRLLLTVGEHATTVADIAEEHGIEAYPCIDAADAAEVLSERMGPHDVVLIKGSHAMHLDTILPQLDLSSALLWDRWQCQYSWNRLEVA